MPLAGRSRTPRDPICTGVVETEPIAAKWIRAPAQTGYFPQRYENLGTHPFPSHFISTAHGPSVRAAVLRSPTSALARVPQPVGWGGASGHTYTLTPMPDGTTEINAVVVRDGKNFRGHVLGAVIGTVGKRVLDKELVETINAIEARNADGPSTNLA